MADNALPGATPAPNGDQPPAAPAAPAPSEPGAQPADKKPEGTPPAAPANPLDQLTDEEKNYLKGQGIEDFSSPEAIRKIINHGRSSQSELSKLRSQFEKAGIKFEEPPATPPGSSQPQPDSQPSTIDQVTAFNLSATLANNYPTLKDDLTSGKLYKDMQALGIPLHTADKQVNLPGILAYAEREHKYRETQAKLQEASKPGEIPDADPTTPQQPAADAPMTKQMAQAIALHVTTGGTHPRAEEAKQFLQANIGKK